MTLRFDLDSHTETKTDTKPNLTVIILDRAKMSRKTEDWKVKYPRAQRGDEIPVYEEESKKKATFEEFTHKRYVLNSRKEATPDLEDHTEVTHEEKEEFYWGSKKGTVKNVLESRKGAIPFQDLDDTSIFRASFQLIFK